MGKGGVGLLVREVRRKTPDFTGVLILGPPYCLDASGASAEGKPLDIVRTNFGE